MTRPKPKTVRAWAFAVQYDVSSITTVVQDTKARAIWSRDNELRDKCRVGPVVRIEVPAPKERKR